ncbi:MAG: hypothetical protein ACI3YH_06285 [Eubacteriales bacterium]
MKTIHKLSLTALLLSGLLVFSACTAESESAPTTVGTTTAPTPTVTTVTTTSPDDPAVTTTPEVTTTDPTSSTDEPATSEPATIDEPAPATTEELSLAEQMAAMGCPEELIPTIEREANAEEIASIQTFISDPYVRALLCSESFTIPSEIDLRGFIYAGVRLADESHPNGSPSNDERLAVALARGSYTALYADCLRWTSAELNTVLEKYLGISFTNEIGMNMFHTRLETQREIPSVSYYTPTDAYYLFCTDNGLATPTIQSVWRTSDGKYLVHYVGVSSSMVTLLAPDEDQFLIGMVMDLTEWSGWF